MAILDDIQVLKAAIRSGASRVQYANRTVDYRSLEEMRSILKEMELEAGLAKSGRKRNTPYYSKGY